MISAILGFVGFIAFFAGIVGTLFPKLFKDKDGAIPQRRELFLGGILLSALCFVGSAWLAPDDTATEAGTKISEEVPTTTDDTPAATENAPLYPFDYSALSPEDAAVMQAAYPAILEECPDLTEFSRYIEADIEDDGGVDVMEFPPIAWPDGLNPRNSTAPWWRRYGFVFKITNAPPGHPRWNGHRVAVEFATKPVEIGAWKTVGEEMCNLPRDGVRHAPKLGAALMKAGIIDSPGPVRLESLDPETDHAQIIRQIAGRFIDGYPEHGFFDETTAYRVGTKDVHLMRASVLAYVTLLDIERAKLPIKNVTVESWYRGPDRYGNDVTAVLYKMTWPKSDIERMNLPMLNGGDLIDFAIPETETQEGALMFAEHCQEERHFTKSPQFCRRVVNLLQ